MEWHALLPMAVWHRAQRASYPSMQTCEEHLQYKRDSVEHRSWNQHVYHIVTVHQYTAVACWMHILLFLSAFALTSSPFPCRKCNLTHFHFPITPSCAMHQCVMRCHGIPCIRQWERLFCWLMLFVCWVWVSMHWTSTSCSNTSRTKTCVN